MAGIGFRLNRLANEKGLGGIASAAINGALFSSGPWLLTAAAVLLLQSWAGKHLAPNGTATVLTILAYAFTLSTVIAAPVAIVATRMAADSLFANRDDAVSGIFVATLNVVAIPAALLALVLFGLIARLPLSTFVFAMAVLILLVHLWIASGFLTALRRHVPILVAYGLGLTTIAMSILAFRIRAPAAVLAAIATGLTATLIAMSFAIRGEFPAPPTPPRRLSEDGWRAGHLALTGLASALAIWIDKWILWFGDGSIETVIGLRINPINDQASFLALLMIVPSLTFVLVTTETRLSTSFQTLIQRCTGTASYGKIEEARRELSHTIMRDIRLLLVGQAALACICWVLAPEILRVVGADARGIFCFRFTVIGTVFHVIAIYAVLILSYFDLFGRILGVWLAFSLVSGIATLITMHFGLASFGWGYMVGGMAGAFVGLAMVANATGRLIYLLFVGNNPAVVGEARYLV